MEPTKHPEENRKKSQSNAYLKYSGLAFQMIAVMVIAAYAGRRLDAYFQNQIPGWTLTLLIVAVVATVYLTIATLTKEK